MPDNQSRAKTIIYLPITLAIILILGIAIGKWINFSGISNTSFQNKNNNNKLQQIISYIEREYVDTVDLKVINEEAVIALLSQLDPHSQYIPASELKEVNESLEGNFSGIGVEFNIINDTIVVISAIAGGPSEQLGILAGDRIVQVENELVAGVGIKNNDVIKKLRGEKDSKVTIYIKRKGISKLISFEIKRGEIPIQSIDAAFLINKKTGYIKINRFAAKTFDEYLEAFGKLASQGMENLILDLRGNPGGYLNAAIKISDEFLPEGKTIVYTEGKSRPKEISEATRNGAWENKPIYILVDEGSASASEIVAGALQDNDVGKVIGRRTFGKGLVQEQINLPDGSALRLTIARYYTPTGRSIQRPYSKNLTAYYADVYERYEHGELINEDSVIKHQSKNETLKYYTPAGKVVYGGGGITPDIFVPLDTHGLGGSYTELINSGSVNKFSISFCDANRSELKSKYKTAQAFSSNFTLLESDFNNYLQFEEVNKIVKSKKLTGNQSLRLKEIIKAQIGRLIFGNEAYYRVLLSNDKALKTAILEYD